MFIPNFDKYIGVGDEVILNEDINISFGIITRGHIFTVTSIKKYLVSVVDKDGIELNNMPQSSFSKNLTYDESKNKYHEHREMMKILSTIETHCQYRTQCYDEYQPYYGCTISGYSGRSTPDCKSDLSCLKHNKQLARKYKLKKLTNKK